MTVRRASFVLIALIAVLLSGCGFHLRKEAEISAAMKRIHIDSGDASASLLAKNLGRALVRSGAQIVDQAGPGVAVMKITANSFSTDVLSVGGTARANEYSLRYHVEFEVQNDAGIAILPKQTIELSREFTFDASQALGVASETDLLTKELQRDMEQTILRRLDAFARTPQTP
jgi:LPS-assembly lipoprotein